MGPVLKGLIELQIVESRLRGMKARLKGVKKAVVLQEQQLRNLEESLQSHKDKIFEAKHNINKLELELKSRDETVAKYKTALNSAKSNKEYAAILTELNTNKADNSKIESRMLEYMTFIEEEQKACEDTEKKIEEQKQTIESIKVKAADKITECETGIIEVQQKWEEVAKGMPKDALQLFTKLADSYDGEAVCYIEHGDVKSRNYNCGGCFMNVTAETLSQIMCKDDVSQCKNCGRILVFKVNDGK